ncbi:beta strand repeat-containing protein, partial [Sphaerisporangium rufum]|uniref:beta strand repeat-containing protein n=1 Tax=Sphaerisporangium rufum TaxID=1381558 RepID=UPI00194EC073
MAGAVGLTSVAHPAAAAAPAGRIDPSFVIDCGPDRTGPALTLTRELRPDGDRVAVTVRLANPGRADARDAGFGQDLGAVPGQAALAGARASAGTLSYEKPVLRWTGDVPAGHAVRISYAIRPPAGEFSIPTLDTTAGRTCQEKDKAGGTAHGTPKPPVTAGPASKAAAPKAVASSKAAARPGAGAATSPVTGTSAKPAAGTSAKPAAGTSTGPGKATGTGPMAGPAAGPATPGAAPARPVPAARPGAAQPGPGQPAVGPGAQGSGPAAEPGAGTSAKPGATSADPGAASSAGAKSGPGAGPAGATGAKPRSPAAGKPGSGPDATRPGTGRADQAESVPGAGRKAARAPITFGQRYLDNYRGSVTRAGNTLVTCYPPAVADCLTRRFGSGNNNVAATFVDVDSDASTFNSSTADLTLTPGAQVAYARLYWGARSQTTTDTPGLPAGNRFAPNIALRGQISLKVPGSATYQTITASPGDIGDTPDNVTAAGIVYGASADVTALVSNAGPGTYAAGNLQVARGSDGLGAFGGWSLVVAYRDPNLPLRNISIFDGFLEQQNNTPATTITLSGFQTPVTGNVNVQLGQIAYDGDNAIVGDSLSVKSTNGPLTVLTDALHPADNFFNSTIANLGTQVTDRNPTYTNTLGYDSNIINASSAFRNNDTSAQFTFSTVGDAYWPQAFWTQIDLHQANIQSTKSAQVVGGGTPRPGSVIQYTITATNTGDDNAVNVLLADPIPANTTYVPETIVIASGPNAGPKTDAVGDDQAEFVGNTVQAQLGVGAGPFNGGTLVPGQSTSVTFQVTLDATAAGTSVVDSSTVTYASADTPTQVGTSTATTSTVVPALVSSITLLKTASPSTVTAAGQAIAYSFLVTNNGETTLTGVTAADTAFSGTGTPPVITCPVTTLTPGQSTTCTGSYAVTQADVDAGAIVNTAVATGTPPTGPPVTSTPSTVTVTAAAVSSIALLKTASPTQVGAAGRTVTYSYLVTNTGNTTLTALSVADTVFTGTGTPPVITCPVTTLSPGQSTTCTGTYVTTQADVGNGGVLNTAVATGTPPSGPPVNSPPSSATVTIPSTPSLALSKTASPATVTQAGQTVTYSFAIRNTGNRTMNGIAVTETAFSGTGAPPVATCPVSTLAPGATTTCTATYVVTQADINAGTVADTAVASGTPPGGTLVNSNPSSATVTATPLPSLALLKTASPATVPSAGRTVTYSFQVTNTGNTTLTSLSVADTVFTGTGTPPVITCPVTTLQPGQVTTCTGTYVTTQADVGNGGVLNTAVATGTPPSGPPVNSPPSSATVTIPSTPSLALSKTASPATVTQVGQTVTYSFAIVNTGNRTMNGIAVVDTVFSGTGPPPVVTCPVTTLAPQASTTCTGTYAVTQADINAGTVANTAVASGTPPGGSLVNSNPSSATVTATQLPSLALLKTASPATVPSAGRTVTYSYQVTNTGNTTLTALSVADTAFSGTGPPPSITCPVSVLLPGQVTTCTGTYVTTQPDVGNGGVLNTAVATGTPPSGPPVNSPPSSATVTIPSTPSLALSKTASPATVTQAGQTVTYSFAIVNTGNRTMNGIAVTETVFSGTGAPPVATCPVSTLAPGAATTCTATYVVTQADINAGTVANTAVASGTPPGGSLVNSNPSSATVTAPQLPGITLLKTASPATVPSAGRTVTYSFLVTNTGNDTLTSLSVADTVFTGTGTPPVITCPVTTLQPGQSTTCTGTYVTTQQDVGNGGVLNTAVATGTPPSGPPVDSPPSSA